MHIAMRGEVALVTGGGGGIGRETALLLAGAGARVAVCDLDGGAARATADAIGEMGGTAWAGALDVADSGAVERAVADAAAALGSVSALANIAGIYRVAALEDIADEDWARMFAVHVDGSFHCCRAVLPGMAAARSGAIVNMSSLHALRGQANAAHYAAAKGAIIGLTKSIAREKGPLGIRANAVAPGPIDTPLWRGAVPPDEIDAVMAKRSEIIPIGRLGQPAEVAQTIVHLLSPAASYITGQVVTIDGGESMA